MPAKSNSFCEPSVSRLFCSFSAVFGRDRLLREESGRTKERQKREAESKAEHRNETKRNPRKRETDRKQNEQHPTLLRKYRSLSSDSLLSHPESFPRENTSKINSPLFPKTNFAPSSPDHPTLSTPIPTHRSKYLDLK